MMLELKKIVEPLAVKLSERFALSDEGKSYILSPHMETVPFLKRLIEEGCYRDAVKVLAYSLPHREAVWWSYLCVELNEQTDSAPISVAARYLVQQWVFNQDENARIGAYALATKNEIKKPSAWCAFAVYFAASAEHQPPIEHQFLTHQAVATAILLTVHQLANGDLEKMQTYYQQFIKKGLHIANGGNGKIEEKM